MNRFRERAGWALQSGVRAALFAEARRFDRAVAGVEQAQRARLQAVLGAVRGSRQGQALGLRHVRTARELQDAVPVGGPDSVAPWVDAMLRGEHDQLTFAPPLRFELSGGSSGPSKHVPMTRALLSEFHRALAPWLFDLLTARPALRRGPSYWSISPIGARGGRSPGGLPIGSASDASYFPALLRPVVELLLAVPGEVAGLPDVESCRYVTLRCLLERAEVAFLSVWNPSFLSLLLDAVDQGWERLAEDLEEGTCRPPTAEGRLPAGLRFGKAPLAAARLRSLYAKGARPTAKALFPRLALVSCWTDADAGRALPALVSRLGGVEVQGKGLLATEGVVTFPLFDAPAPVLAVRSHFFEFLDVASPDARPLLAHQLSLGQSYEVLLSTSGGFLRYRLGDRVRVEGFHRQAPCLRFLGRADAVVDLVGEKLSADWASRALTESLRELALEGGVQFAMLGPEWSAPPAYHLFVDGPVGDEALTRLARALEARLSSGHAYGYARRLGQLGAVQAVRVQEGRARYESRCVALGQRAGDIKPTDLHRQPGWLAHFAGKPL
jgi:hypothetical protein